MQTMKIQRSSRQTPFQELALSTAPTRALRPVSATERHESRRSSFLSYFLQILFALPLGAVRSIANRFGAASFLSQYKLVEPNYRLLEENLQGDSNKTALVMVRPSLLELVTESVPAIDLENRHELMCSIAEMMSKVDLEELDRSKKSLSLAQSEEMKIVTVIDEPRAIDAKIVAHLFRT